MWDSYIAYSRESAGKKKYESRLKIVIFTDSPKLPKVETDTEISGDMQ